jgi:hypothetical protein
MSCLAFLSLVALSITGLALIHETRLRRAAQSVACRLAPERGGDPDQHWLRKMPDETEPWRYREKAVKYLTRAMTDFERESRDRWSPAGGSAFRITPGRSHSSVCKTPA